MLSVIILSVIRAKILLLCWDSYFMSKQLLDYVENTNK